MFKLNFDIPRSKETIHIKDPLYLIGSCFSDEIGQRLLINKFEAISNPFGTIYNPTSIFKLMRGEFRPENIIESQGVYYHWDCHGEIAGLSPEELNERFLICQEQSKAFLQKTKWLIITLGTSYIYRLKSTDQVVANCHKVPQKEFAKELLTTESIIEDFNQTMNFLKSINKGLQIIFTVSPVRHVRDGLVENNRSKGILINATQQIVDNYDNCSYFPSYEIMIDELRDYRFYRRDRIHPSEEAVDYIWDRFIKTCFDEESQHFLEEWKKVKSALNHRPFNPKSEAHQYFIKKTLDQLNQLNELVDVSVEKESLEKQLL